MKRLHLIFFLFLLATSVFAEDLRFTCKFRVEDEQNGTLVVQGTAFVQGECYRCETQNGMMCSDGHSRWIFYSETDELLIQQNDISMFDGVELSAISSGMVCYSFKNFKVSLSDIKMVKESWPESFFVMDSESMGEETIVTDLR